MNQITAYSNNLSTKTAHSMDTTSHNINGGESNGTTDELTAEKLTELQNPNDVKISPPGWQVVYSLQPVTRTGDLDVSLLYIGDIGTERSK